MLALATLACGAASARAHAVPELDHAPPRVNGLTVEGQVEVEEASVTVRCRTARQRSRCVVGLRFTVRSEQGAVIHFPPVPGGRFTVDGVVVGADDSPTLSLAPGEVRRVALRVRRALWEDRSDGLYLMAEAAWTRHALLGEFQHIRRSGHVERVTLFEGDGWRLRGSLRVTAPGARRVTVTVDDREMPSSVAARLSTLPAFVTIRLARPRATPRWLRRGGPLFMLGTTLGAQRALVGRAGYEAGFGRHGFVQGLLETDFRERVAVVLLLEGALLSPLYLIPSLSAGVGLKLETRADPHVALRFSVGANMGPGLGVQGTLDWDPGGRRVTGALAGRLSF